jgi:rhodanese-related sulfurtransferase
MTALQSQTTAPAATGLEVDVATAHRMFGEAGTVMVDVREADEHARERIVGSRLIPLSSLTAKEIQELGARRVLLHCRGGRRSLDAATRCAGLASGGVQVLSVAGGIEAWKKAGLGTQTNASRPRMSVMQQTQLTIGVMVATGTALGYLVHPGFLALPALMGCGLIFAGATGTCGLAAVLGKAPWNRMSSCGTGSCSSS